ncbi:MAG: hypothetical protein ACREBW_00880, partial [Candidatus Micrarchaeaceae archaeon]
YTGTDTKLGSHIEIGDECYTSPSMQLGGYDVQPIWSRRQAACAIAPWPWAAFPYPVKNAPAIATDGQNLLMAWTLGMREPFSGIEQYGSIQLISNASNGGLNFSQPISLRVSGDRNPQYSIDQPALCVGLYMNLTFIAWTAGNDPKRRINVMYSGAPMLNLWGNRTTFEDDRSNSAPALTAAPLLSTNATFGAIFLAYTDQNQKIHIRWSFDGGWYDFNKKELEQWSPDGPGICYADPYLYLAFRATSGDTIYVCRTADFGQTLEVNTIPNQATDYTPAMAVVGKQLILAWRGTDPYNRINAMSTDLTSSDPLGSFGNQVIYGDQANGALSMVNLPVNGDPFIGKPYIAWAGTDPGHSLNVMPLPPYIQSCFS